MEQRCAAAERAGGTSVDRLTGLLAAYFGMGFELFGRSEHMPELAETFSRLARFEDRRPEDGVPAPARGIFAIAPENGRDRTPPARAYVGTDCPHPDSGSRGQPNTIPKVQGHRKALRRRLRELSILAIAAMKT